MQSTSKNPITIAIVVLLILVATIGAGHSFAVPKQKKLIYYGWGTRDTMYVRDHWQSMEQLPLDGIVISVAIDRSKPTIGDGATANILGWQLWGIEKYRMQDFRPALDDMKSVKWSKFKSNFLIACISSAYQDNNFNWYDDKRWNTILNNWKIYVTLAKESGCKGIIIDPESYGGCLFAYKEMNKRRPGSFDTYKAKIRARARQLMRVTNEIYPDITLPLYLSNGYTYYYTDNESKPLEENYYGLLPAFIDGLLEASDKRTKFIDLNEGAYGGVGREGFLEWYHLTYNRGLKLSAVPELYRTRMSAGFPVWIDCSYYEKSWDTNDFSKNYYSPDSLKTALQSALDVTDEYVWIYSEKGPSFFPLGNLPEPYLKAMREAKQ